MDNQTRSAHYAVGSLGVLISLLGIVCAPWMLPLLMVTLGVSITYLALIALRAFN